MAHRTTHPLNTPKSEAHLLTAKLTGGGAAADLVNADADNMGAGEIVSATYSSTGVFTVVFRHAYAALLAAPVFSFVGASSGMTGKCTAIDVAAKTATFLIGYSTTPADPATTDTIYVSWIVRNSGRNA